MFEITPALLFQVQVKQLPTIHPFKAYGSTTSGTLTSQSTFPKSLSATILHSNSVTTVTPTNPLISQLDITGLAELSTGSKLIYHITGKFGMCQSMLPIISGEGTGNAFAPVRFGQTKNALTVRFETDGGEEWKFLEENVFVGSSSMACGEKEGEFAMDIDVAMVSVVEKEFCAREHPEGRK